MNQEEFLARLRARPAGSHLPEEPAPPSLPAVPADLAAAFAQAAEATGSRVVRGNREAVRRALRDFGGEQPALAQPASELRELLEGLEVLPEGTDPFDAAWGASLADGGLAYTGSACLRRTRGTPLVPSLVPPRAAIVVPVNKLVWELGDYLQSAPREGTVHVVSGPSRSADIENDLSIGVHGPGEVLYLLLEA